MTKMKPAATEASAHTIMGRVKTSYPRLLRLLVPMDFSGKSRQALRYAIPLAQKFAARIHLVHVLPDTTKKTAGPELARAKQAAIKRLGEMSELLPPKARAGNAVLTGNPAEEILGLAAKNNIDLIILTTKGRSGLKRVLVGSTAEHIMRHAQCPVMSVRRQ